MRIQDYAIIGDCRTAALVSREGSIDWLCWPRFDSPALFGALLDERAGRWRIAPTAPFRSERHYIEGTNVLETRFETDAGTLLVTDLMPVASEGAKRAMLLPSHQIVRRVACERGEVEVEALFQPRPQYGRGKARMRPAGKLGIRVETGQGLLLLRSDLPHDAAASPERADGTLKGRATLRVGDVRYASLTFDDQELAVIPPLGSYLQEAVDRSVAWWRDWAAQFTYQGPCRGAVLRSALLLKLLVYAPSGAIVAAPTTSLPERIGGELNWDYRFCWLRDAALTMRALFGLGFVAEAQAFLSWLLHSTRTNRTRPRNLYDVHGNKPRPERTLDELSGYRGSRPVRVGNAAVDQLQLDVHGAVIDAATQFVRRGGTLDGETQRMLRDFGDYVCKNWQRPDEGIWEPRSGKAHHTHSRLLCWTALERLLELHDRGQLASIPIERYAHNRQLIARQIHERAWNDRLGSYVAELDGEAVDASLLLLPWYGFESASSERMRRTHSRITAELGAPGGLLYRYRDKESPGEGTFGICSFWGAEFLARGGGTPAEARAVFEQLVAGGNDVGLFAEELDPDNGDALGNFPQAFTHVGLVNAALSLEQRLGERADVPPVEAHP